MVTARPIQGRLSAYLLLRVLEIAFLFLRTLRAGALNIHTRLDRTAMVATTVVVVLILVGCGGVDDVPGPTEVRIDAVLLLEGDALLGQSLYTMECTSCHDGAGGAVSGRGAQITFAVPERSDRSLLRTLLEGRACTLTMPSYAELEDQQLADLLVHLRETFTETSSSPPSEGCRGESNERDASTSG